MLRFPVDDVTTPITSIELHVPRGNDTIKVAVGVFTPPDPTKTPRIHVAPIQPGYARVAVDQVSKGYEDLVLDIPGGDGEKTLGEAEMAYILWRKRYNIIPGASAPPPPVVASPDHHSAQGNDDAFEGTAASPPSPTPLPPPRKSTTPPPRSPTPLPPPKSTLPPRRSPTPPPPPRKPAPKRSTPQTKPLPCPPTKKQKANTHLVIPQKLSYEKSEQELKDAVQKEGTDFFEGAKQARRVRENPEPSYFFLPPDQLRKKLKK